MLSKEDNELLCRVGPGTPMGELWRRFWFPALLSSELPKADSDPVRVRLLGEDLVAFRDTNGKVGIIAANCPHRGASLFFGRNEEAGLRCVYHGWKFDAEGNCVDMPNEPAESDFRTKVKATTYPTREAGTVIWIYMGPPDKMPVELPQLEWVTAPAGYQHVSKWFHESNWFQGAEGEIDTSHISFLHSWMDPDRSPNPQVRANLRVATRDGAPKLTLEETRYGFRYGARRNMSDDEYYWRVTQWLLPDYSLIPSPGPTYGGRCWVPIDDEHTWAFGYQARTDRPYTQEEIDQIMQGAAFPPRLIPGTFMPLANKSNDWLIDRELQKTGNYTGIWGINEQDRALQEDEAMAPIMDRRKEHLGTADLAIIAARRILLRLARDLQKGIEPVAPHEAQAYAVRQLNVFSSEPSFQNLIQEQADELVARKVQLVP
jgi:phthalate 4,5-dioxygenase oxygenase subunit